MYIVRDRINMDAVNFLPILHIPNQKIYIYFYTKVIISVFDYFVKGINRLK